MKEPLIFDAELYAQQILHELKESHVAEAFVNRSIPKDARVELYKTVRILNATPISTFEYTGDEADWQRQELQDKQTTFEIERASAYDVIRDDLDELFSAPDLLAEHYEEAAYSLQDDADKYIFSKMVEGVDSLTASDQLIVAGDPETDTDGNPTESRKTALVAALREARNALSNANVPKQGRRIALRPDETGLLEEYMTETLQDLESARRGAVGRAFGFDLYETTNQPVSSGTVKLPFGRPRSTVFADNLVKVERYSPEKAFKQGVKGLYVFGAKAIRPKEIGYITVSE